MRLTDRLRELCSGKKGTAAAVVLGMLGLLLILVSSLFPDGDGDPYEEPNPAAPDSLSAAEEYRIDTENRLAEFLSRIEGAGEVEVFITVGSSERSVYAAAVKRSETPERREVDEDYVIVSEGGSSNALLEAVETPEITGVAVICTGGGSPAVQERVYRAAAAALGVPTSCIYVTSMEQNLHKGEKP